jgi:ABC-type transporter Mla MlaB component
MAMSFARSTGLLLTKSSKGASRLAAPEQSRTALVRALRPPTEPNTIVIVISGPIARADIARLCECVAVLLESCDADLVICDVSALVDADCVTVDVLARLQLTAGRLGRLIRFRHACEELQELLALTGLSDVVPCGPGLRLESRGQTEQREQGRGVEEEADPADPLA